MNDYIIVKAMDDKLITIFTKHITHITPTRKGNIIHLNSGMAGVATELSQEEIVKLVTNKKAPN